MIAVSIDAWALLEAKGPVSDALRRDLRCSLLPTRMMPRNALDMDRTHTSRWIELMPAADLARGSMVGLEIGTRSIAIYHLEDDSFHATDNMCTHAFALLSDGWLEGEVVECPLHGGCFDVRTGKGVCAPIIEDLATHPVEIRDGNLFVLLEDE